jgi:hypothetical protein
MRWCILLREILLVMVTFSADRGCGTDNDVLNTSDFEDGRIAT